jgi:hypothetical protein
MLQTELAQTLNRYSAENGSDTPDFILAQYLTDCLEAWNRAVQAREKWYTRSETIHHSTSVPQGITQTPKP